MNTRAAHAQIWDGSVTRCGARELAPIRDITPQENIYNDYFYYDDDKEVRTPRELYKRCWLFNERAELRIGGEEYRHRALRAGGRVAGLLHPWQTAAGRPTPTQPTPQAKA